MIKSLLKARLMLESSRKKKLSVIKDIEARDVINDEEVLVEMFNNHYANIIENSRVALIELGTPLDSILDQDTVEKILKHYENHPSIIEIKKLAKTNQSFTFPKTKTKYIKIINSLNRKKATGTDEIPIKAIKTASKIEDSHLTNVINEGIAVNSFSESTKVASVRPLYKK